MLILTDEEIWNKVKQLEGKTLNTFIEHEENQILKVEDSGSRLDRVIIKDRQTTPIKEDIIAAYKLLFQKVISNENQIWSGWQVPRRKLHQLCSQLLVRFHLIKQSLT